MVFLSQPNYFNFGQRKLEHQRCAKFYGPSFHQQHDPAMHAKQYHVGSGYCMVMVLMEK